MRDTIPAPPDTLPSSGLRSAYHDAELELEHARRHLAAAVRYHELAAFELAAARAILEEPSCDPFRT